MGKIDFTSLQKLIFEEIASDKYFKDNFYLSGGTALSVFYLHHRYSEDLDLFTPKPLEQQKIISFINLLAKKHKLNLKFTQKEMILWFEVQKQRETLKIDFIYFPYPRLNRGKNYKGFEIDSILDIGANKLVVLGINFEPKDYVDLYFILKEKYSIWKLTEAVKEKYHTELDLVGLGAEFVKAKDLKYLPKMREKLTLKELKEFFLNQAKILGEKLK